MNTDILYDNLSTVLLNNNSKNKANIHNVNECGILLLTKNMKKCLIICQNKSKKWGIPKGYMYPHEIMERKFFDCAKRELFEETGILITNLKYKKVGTRIIKNKLIYYLQLRRDEFRTNSIDKNEIGDLKWECINNLMYYDTYNSNITLLDTNYILRQI